MQLYANVRPVRNFPNVPSLLCDGKVGDIDWVLVRGNSEGESYRSSPAWVLSRSCASPLIWDEVAAEVARDYPDVKWDQVLVDAMIVRMVVNPKFRKYSLGIDYVHSQYIEPHYTTFNSS
ncbi:hypothetical protein ASPSYDRAFT_475185 [Aspergillus sydowii CBS 593.65]|uniref:Uncharacterized protein n=1 Tax=Aspergillus sydowii CBS 593.65 TaxID=1036612 RepID=A0A1L9T5Q4_9EURO|nr:uncharacterized protein ASPSYDRAFT_475185 [Aspergillus sydowii CBS 593.65]OJJ54738.1 hypothetical protein ASPSYDRAFT_475185 [Aspergillus sydowii CBS 593.65]